MHLALPQPAKEPARIARRWVIGGHVQGVGFRPYVYRLAIRLGVAGWVRNQYGRVEIFGQGSARQLELFGAALLREAPPPARPVLIADAVAPPQPLPGFAIHASAEEAPADAHIPLDQPPCAACLAELRDPDNRRYRYPFINCTACGPRYTLITRLPYDRPHTALRDFPLCAACAREYADPQDRRFHAQIIACPDCGPRLQFVTRGHAPITGTNRTLDACIDALCSGAIVGVKGVGGYHLMCDARNPGTIARLRRDKPRPDKPLAVMIAEDDELSQARRYMQLDARHAAALRDGARPIVLAPRSESGGLPDEIAPGLGEIGIMLPYSPLHHLLLDGFGGPLVATSANIRGEPVLTAAAEAEQRLQHLVDAWLHHDRPIEHPADDPVRRIIGHAARPLRLGRGAAPLELALPFALPRPHLAVGGQIKNTIALGWDSRIVISPHIGELDTPRGRAVFEKTIADLQGLYGVRAQSIVCDRHPRYASRRWALASGLPITEVFHHHAHAAALAGEYPEVERWLVFTWDGLGYGPDGALWGGEALLGVPGNWRRVTSLRPFRLPGGERAAREPWRSAQSLCWESGLRWDHAPDDGGLLQQAWHQGINCPPTSSVGRLFDAAAALTGLLTHGSYEGHGPAHLEAAAQPTEDFITLPLTASAGDVHTLDWAPLLPMLLDASLSPGRRAGLFHASLAHALLAQAQKARDECGAFTVGLGGGVFQNRLLTEQACALLAGHGFEVRLSDHVPCNDGGLSYGQIIEALYRDEIAARTA
ncbi:MAG: carbamoyltransferase HypF [Rhodanobacteraceae bacterium]|nr:carbamoyltransferase HypF [Rhodanobacteraceae bacterium]